MSTSRIFWLGSLLCTGLLACLLAFFGPVRISITLARDEQKAAAAPQADLPTTTPVPPSATPLPPTATVLPPTDVPATPTADQLTATPRKEKPPRRQEPSPTPETISSEMTPVPTELPRYPNIRIHKSSDVREGLPGDRLTFTLTAQNNGQLKANDVVVSDSVPDVLEVIDLRSSKGDIVVDGQLVSAYPRSLDAAESAVYTIVTRIRNNAKAGEYMNMALITTSTEREDPGDNSSSLTFIVKQPPVSKQTIQPPPSKLPRTNDPDTPTNMLAIYWPLLLMAVLMFAAGVAMRQRAFDVRAIRVFSGAPRMNAAQPVQIQPHTSSVDLILDPDALYQQWQQGTTVAELTSRVVQTNPHADRLTIAMAIQGLLSEYVEKR